MEIVKKYSLETAVFICGAAVMVLELAGSRILAPYLGVSLYTWASVIGVVLGSLSLGYWIGGIKADHNPTLKALALIVLASSFSVALINVIRPPVFYLTEILKDPIIGPLLASLLLFSLPNVLLGMVSPYAARLKIKNAESSGKAVGNLYAISTGGSIFGTFLAGFWLISSFGNTAVIWQTAFALVVASLIVNPKKILKLQLFAVIFIIAVIFIFSNSANKNNEIHLDTPYSHYFIKEEKDPEGKAVRELASGPYEIQSIMYIEPGIEDKLYPAYPVFYRLAEHFNPSLEHALMIGGGAYSFPKDFLMRYPDAKLDVVEYDAKLTEIAKQYFNLKEDPRLNIFHEDGRMFLRKNKNTYDTVYMDAFSATFSIPYHLTTKETAQEIYDSLSDNGIVLVNIYSSLSGPSGKFLRSEYHTYKSVFPQVYVLAVKNPNDPGFAQNQMLIALKSEVSPSWKSQDPELNEYLQHRWTEEIKNDLPLLTDEFAPAEQYAAEMIPQVFSRY